MGMKFSESLKKNRDFKSVYSSRKSRADLYLVVYVISNGTEKNRLGISVSKKIGNSVLRHHLTRQIREIYRLNEESFKRGFDIVVVARKEAARSEYDRLRRSFLKLASMHGIMYE